MNWKSVKEELPKENVRILVYSPEYDEDILKYRIADSHVVKYCKSITHWTYLEKPKGV